MSKEMREQIERVKNWVQFLNEKTSEMPFDDKIKYELKRYLEGTIYGKVGKSDERATELMDIHKKFINSVKDKMSADKIAKSLFHYEINNLLNR